MEDGAAGGLPVKEEDEFRPFVRRLPEFKFWYSATQAIVISIVCSFFTAFDLPVFWPVLVMYFIILFILTSMYFSCSPSLHQVSNYECSAATDPTHDQVPICSFHCWQDAIRRVFEIIVAIMVRLCSFLCRRNSKKAVMLQLASPV
jgi:hypothetical protein